MKEENPLKMPYLHRILVLSLLILPATLNAQRERDERLEITRMVAHWTHVADADYLKFIEDIDPDLVQMGFYGGHFWSLAHTDQYGGYPSHHPVKGLKECGDWYAAKNQELHDRDVLVIGHFNVEFLVGDPESPDGPRGFFKFYKELWDEAELGPKPVEDPLDFLEKGADGMPIVQDEYKIGGMREYWACLRNPNWQKVLKAWIKRGIERGVDGFIANYFYRHNCLCEHCQAGFRGHLAENYNERQLKSNFKIDDLAAHKFEEIVSWHKPDESTPLRMEALKWSQISNKKVFDEVFNDYGRSLKPDLITAQWNHISNFSQLSGDERCLLPADLWGKGEDYLWYSMGSSGFYTDLAQEFYGEGTLQSRYIRGAFDDKPFTLGKYENVRTRVAIAELAANGGTPMGFYARFTDPDMRAVFVQYYQFIKRYDDLFRANSVHAEARLLFPRKAVHAGDVAAVETFRQTGKRWLDEHVLFSVIPDDLVRTRGDYYDGFPDDTDAELSKFEAPKHVRVSGSRPAGGGEIDLHFVNYNREELPKNAKGEPNPGKGNADEKPIAIESIAVDFALPPNFEIGSAEFITPEHPDPRPLAFEQVGHRLKFTTPDFLVYGVARLIEKKEAPIDVAGITTIYGINSHAEMLFGRLVKTDTLDGKGDTPPLRLTSVFTDQLPEKDLSREYSKQYGFTIAENAEQSLTSGGELVDAVFLVAEHGDYPMSDTGQIVYPKRKMFEAITKVFEKEKKVVPVFFDKHFADNWEDAKWIYDKAKEMKIPLMAGSSIPTTWRYPEIDLKRDAKVKEIVAVNFGRLDAYGFHALEGLQALVERRAGGETGVKSVQCLTGEAVWEAGKVGVYDEQLLDRVVAGFRERKLPEGKTIKEQMRNKEPVLFHIEYEDGLRASVLTLNGVVAEWAAAWRYADDSSVESLSFLTPETRPYYHFSVLLSKINGFMHTGEAPWPVERTLLTTGMLDALLISNRDGGKKVETPYLQDVEYQSKWDWTQPSPPPPGRGTYDL